MAIPAFKFRIEFTRPDESGVSVEEEVYRVEPTEDLYGIYRATYTRYESFLKFMRGSHYKIVKGCFQRIEV